MAIGYLSSDSYNPNIGPYFKIGSARQKGKKIQFKRANKKAIVLQGWTKLSSGAAVLIYDILPFVKAIVIPLNKAYNAESNPDYDSSDLESHLYQLDYDTRYDQHLKDWYCTCALSNSSTQSELYFQSYNGIGGAVMGTYPKILFNDGQLFDSSTFLSSLMNPSINYPYSYNFTIYERITFSGYHNGYVCDLFGYNPFTGYLSGTDHSKTVTYAHTDATASDFYHNTHVEVTRSGTITARFTNGLTLGGHQIPIIFANDIENPMKYKTTDQVFYLDDYTAYPFNSGMTWSDWISSSDYKNIHNIFKSDHFTKSGTDIKFSQEPFGTSPATVYSNATLTTKVKDTDTIIANHKYYTITYSAI